MEKTTSLHEKIIRHINYRYREFENRNDEELLINSFSNGDCTNMVVESKLRLCRLLNYSVDKIPYYKKLSIQLAKDEDPIDMLKRFPIMNREILRDNYDDLLSPQRRFYLHYHSKTSGTTGIPLEFVSMGPNGEKAHQSFLYKCILDDYNTRIDCEKIVSFGGAYLPDELTEKKVFWVNETPSVYGSELFSSFYVLRENIPYIISELERKQPYIIRGYPTVVSLLVDYCQELGIRPNIDIRGIYLTSENVDPAQMKKIAKFFNCGVHGQYGHAEAAVFGFTKDCDTKYYCSPLYGYTRVVDSNGNDVPIGQIGEVAVTGLSNYAMPFINYKTGDLAEFGGYENGFVVLNRIIGRCQDYVVNEDGEKIFIVVGQLSECFSEAMNHVESWQAVQDEKGMITLRIIKKDVYTQDDENRIKEMLLESKVHTEFEYVNSINLTNNGKRKYVINNIV